MAACSMTLVNKQVNDAIAQQKNRLQQNKLMQTDSKDIRNEYAAGVSCLREALQQHLSYCLFHDFDQIRDTDKIDVTCVHCGKHMRVSYEQLALRPCCNDCKPEDLTPDEMQRLADRLATVQSKLMSF